MKTAIVIVTAIAAVYGADYLLNKFAPSLASTLGR